MPLLSPASFLAAGRISEGYAGPFYTSKNSKSFIFSRRQIAGESSFADEDP